MEHGNFSFDDIESFFDDELEETSCSPIFYKWVPVLLIFFMVSGILINGSILLTFIKLPRARSFTNYFVANLALADILMVILNPVLILLLLYEKVEYGLGDILQFYCEFFFSMASLICFACISVDRMLAIAKPLYHRTLPRSRFIKAIILIWLFSIVVTFIDFIVSAKAVVNDLIITCLHFSIAFAIPTLITLISYSMIARVVICRRKKTFQEADHFYRVRMKHNIRVTWKILLVILPGVIAWCVYWVPVFLDFKSEEGQRFSLSFLQIRSLVPIFAAVVNPLIFILLTPDFRNHLLKYVCRRSRRERTTITNTSKTTEMRAATMPV